MRCTSDRTSPSASSCARRARTRRRTPSPSRRTSGRSGTPRRPIGPSQMPIDPTLPKNAVEAANREAGEAGTRRVGGHGDRGASEEDRRPATLDIYAKRVADAVRQELQVRDPDERVPLFVFAAEPTLSQFMERAHNHRRIVAVQGAPDRLGPSEIDEALRGQLSSLNINEAEYGTARTRRGKRRPRRTRPRRHRAARRRRRRRDAVVRLHHVGQRHARPRVGCDRVRDRQRRGRGTARRHARRRRAAGTRAARDGEGREGRHGAQRRPRRDGVVGTRRWRNSGTRWPDGQTADAARRPRAASDRRRAPVPARRIAAAHDGDRESLAPSEADLHLVGAGVLDEHLDLRLGDDARRAATGHPRGARARGCRGAARRRGSRPRAGVAIRWWGRGPSRTRG